MQAETVSSSGDFRVRHAVLMRRQEMRDADVPHSLVSHSECAMPRAPSDVSVRGREEHHAALAADRHAGIVELVCHHTQCRGTVTWALV